MKNILLTGATGFLGSHLTKRFVREGHRTSILIRKTSDLFGISDVIDRVCIHYVEDGIENAFKQNDKFDVIIHTACCYGHKKTFSQIANTNLSFALELLDLAQQYNTDTFFNTDTILPKYLNWHSLSKKQFVEWGKMVAENNGPKFINLKLVHMYGPGDTENKFTAWIINSCKNSIKNIPLTSCNQQRDFIYIDDVVNVYNLLLCTPFSTVFSEFEIGSGKAIPIKKFVETVHRLTCSSSHLQFDAVPLKEREAPFSVANIEKLKKMGWSPEFDLEQGINKTLSVNKEK